MNISVIIPCFNMEHYLLRCLASVLWQLQPDDEVIVFMDGCEARFDDKEVQKLAEAFNVYRVPFAGVNCEKRINLRFLYSHLRKGVSHARNRAIEVAVNPWVKMLDCDDILAPFALAGMRQLNVSLAVQLIAGWMLYAHNGVVLRSAQSVPDWRVLTRRNPCLPSQTIVRRQALLEVGMFDERIEFEEDWDLWLKLARKFPNCFANAPFPLCYYWIDDRERAAKVRNHNVEGMDVREYFAKTYGITPER